MVIVAARLRAGRRDRRCDREQRGNGEPGREPDRPVAWRSDVEEMGQKNLRDAPCVM
jgi:hypothetical protein